MGPYRLGRAALRATSFGAWTLLAMGAWRAWTRVRPTDDNWLVKQRAVARWSRAVVPILGVDLAIHGSVPDDGPFLVVSNHRSPVDILLAIRLVGGVVLSHAGVADIPVIGTAARVNETIFVDQSDRASGARAVRAMRRHLLDGHNVIVFPEGDTFAGDEVRPFQGGAFTAARGLDEVRVLPLGLAYDPGSEYVDESFEEHLVRNAANRSTHVTAVIGRPLDVPARGRESEVRDAVQALVDEAARLRDARDR